jgi:cutinase
VVTLKAQPSIIAPSKTYPPMSRTKSLYGDTQKKQDQEQIPNFPKEKVQIICQVGDAVCNGVLTVLPAHLTYGVRADEGVEFLTKQIKGVQAKIKARNAKRDAENAAADVVKKVAREIVA